MQPARLRLREMESLGRSVSEEERDTFAVVRPPAGFGQL